MNAPLRKFRRIKARLDGGTAAAVDVPYEVTCDCGGTVTGKRRSSWIEAECENCCQSLFVLPVNVYPSTPSVPSEVLGGSFQERLKTVVRELFPQRKKAAENTPPVPQKGDAKAGRTPKNAARVAAAQSAPAADPWWQKLPKFRLPQFDIKGALQRTFTPFRLLMLAMLTVIGLTIYWIGWQQRLDRAQQTWSTATEKIEEQLADSDLAGLQLTLKQAIDAGYALGKSGPDWRSKLNLLQETAAVNTMAPGDLLTALQDVYDEQNMLVQDAQRKVSDVAVSGTFVFDSRLRPDGTSKSTFLLEFPAPSGHHAIHIVLPMPQVAELIEQSGDGRVFFAARFQSVQAPADSGQPWRLLIEPASFVLMTSAPHCQSIGLSVADDPDLNRILERQKAFVESSPTWEHRADDVELTEQFVRREGV